LPLAMGEMHRFFLRRLLPPSHATPPYLKARWRIFPAAHGQWRFEVKKKRQISEHERQRRAWQRAMSVQVFCDRYDIGRTSTYAEINSGRLKARKAGRRTIITVDDAEEWLSRLPALQEVLDEAS
jgi:hypothetical protein